LGLETGLFPIGMAAKMAGISRQSLQYYLMMGLVEPTKVTRTGRRLFDQKAVERIRLVKKLNRTGYPLRAIRELFLEGRTDLTRLGRGDNKAREAAKAPSRSRKGSR
jgi:DNA-binding transcriptional MerR regulator